MTDDLTRAFQIQQEQTQIIRTYGIDGVATRFDSRIVAKKGVLSEHAVYLQRSRVNAADDSGWYIGPRDGDTTPPDADHLEAFHACALLSKRPSLLKLLVLPYDYLAVVDGDRIEAVLNERDEVVEPLMQ